MSDIFISYSKADYALALKLATFLESEGWSVWWDRNLGAADHYRDEIMKQLVAARAVITIWSPNSIQSDWVRAEAGRAKADGKLIPVKTPDLTYADIPLPFGEMHTENLASTGLIRAAIVAQLSKPASPQAPFWQVTKTFKYQALTWVGILGTTITVFANLQGVLDLADWASELVSHWHEWNQIIWGWVFSLIGVTLPKQLVPMISFSVFIAILIVGVNLAEHRVTTLREHSNGTVARPTEDGLIPSTEQTGAKVLRFVVGALLYLLANFAMGVIDAINRLSTGASLFTNLDGRVLLLIGGIVFFGFPIGYLLCVVKEQWPWVLVASVLFFVMSFFLLLKPLLDLVASGDLPFLPSGALPFLTSAFCVVMVPILWMAVILFSPLQQLTRRLGFVVLGVLTLVALSEISQLNLHQYVKPPKVSANFSR
jgi:hypothetical protein